MKSNQRKIRLAVSGVLLVAVVATGVFAYRQTQTKEEQAKAQQEETTDEQSMSLSQLAEDVNTSNADADLPEQETEVAEPPKTSEMTVTPEVTETPAETPEPEAGQTSAETILPSLEFDENTVLTAPMSGVSGEVLIPYSMDRTVYFPTLDVYKCSPAVVLAAAVDTPVGAIARSQVVSVEESPETGLTVTMDMGNGYQAIYGQLKDVTLQAGDLVEAGTVIGSIQTPTKYYVKEGSNLFFEMKKDGAALDPTEYLALQAE